MRTHKFKNAALLAAALAVVLAGCNSTSSNAPQPDLSAQPVANPLPPPPGTSPGPAATIAPGAPATSASPALDAARPANAAALAPDAPAAPGLAGAPASQPGSLPGVTDPVAPIQQARAPAPSGIPLVSDPNVVLPSGEGCAGSTARFQTLIDSDVRSGHTTRGVHQEISKELASLRGRCAGGEDITDEVTLLRQRYGYPSS
jgi:hypothetical protein